MAKSGAGQHTFAKMIITVWEVEDENYFTLTFTTTESSQKSTSKPYAQPRQAEKAAMPIKQQSLVSSESGSSSSSGSGSGSQLGPSSVTSGRRSSRGGSSNSSTIISPTSATMSSSPFPPMGPPNRSPDQLANSPSSLQKITMMRDALLDNTDIPIIAMWKDQTFTVPNRAARRLFYPFANLTNIRDRFDLVTKWHIWDENFETQLNPAEYPISILTRTEIPFSSRKIGMYDPDTNERLVLDCLGEAIIDEHTGEFLAGVLTCRDITKMTKEITEIKQKDEQQFEIIFESMPQIIWTTSPDGMHDWFSKRWY